jgi:Xaa-Pro aminopeptidase
MMDLMPALEDDRLESFAWLLARDFTPLAAARACSYKAREQTAAARAERPEVVARVAEIRRDRERGGSGALHTIIERLLDYAEKVGAAGDAASVNQARLCLNDAARLKELLPSESPPFDAARALKERRELANRYG